MITLAYFFLIHSGEYNASTSDRTPFCLCNANLSSEKTILAHIANTHDLKVAMFTILEFTTQKNGVRVEKMVKGVSKDPLICCPTAALLHRILYLREHTATPTDPLTCIGTLWPTISSI